MVMTLNPDTVAALEANRLIPRYLLHIEGRNRSTGDIEEVNIWTGELPLNIPVIDPKDQSIVYRAYQAGHGWLTIPPIPQKIELEARSLRLTFSRLPPSAINIIRAYDPKLGKVEIHRALFDPDTHQIVDPAYCMFLGFVNRAPIEVPAVGGEGTIELECSTNSRYLTRKRGDKFSDEFMKRRHNDRFGKYLDVAGLWRVFWGEEDSHIGKGKSKRKEKYDS